MINDPSNGIEICEWVLDYYNKPIIFPSWYDQESVIRGQKFASKHFSEIAMGLANYSLPITYAFRGSKILVLSEQLTHNVDARTLRSFQFVKDMFDIGSFLMKGDIYHEMYNKKNQYAIRTCQTLRLIHSAVRIEHKNTFIYNTYQ